MRMEKVRKGNGAVRVRAAEPPRTVSQVMTARPATIGDRDTVGLAHQAMLWLGVRHLPVIRGDRLVGMISDRDLLGAVALHGRKQANLLPVKDLMRVPVESISPSERIEDAAARLAALKIGALPVVEREKLVGIVTTIDLLSDRSMGPFSRGNGHTATARQVMTADPVTIGEEETIVDAAAAMAAEGVRHLPVVDGTGRLTGMLSDRDIRAALGDPVEALRERRGVEERTVETVMVADPVRVSVDSLIGEVAETLVSERIGAVPVVDGADRPVGIVSYVDLLAWLARTQKKGEGS